MAAGIFERYDAKVKEILAFERKGKKKNGPPKALAIVYSENKNRTVFDGRSVVRSLYDEMADKGWTKKEGKNWHWREDANVRIPESGKEVRLERIVAESRDKPQMEWTWQMSTSSGIEEREPGDKLNAANKRRSVDLVRDHGNDRYSFVELKVGADNPLYALFEILGYALAYLHARRGGREGTGTHNVMQAKHIRLVVLGPKCWYRFDKGDPSSPKFELQWMADELTNGLKDLSKSKPEFSIAFEEFGDHESLEEAAADIIGLANKWLMK